MMSDKCIVHGCPNRKGEGTFFGDLCGPCHHMLTTGQVQEGGETFVHGLAQRAKPPVFRVTTEPTSMRGYSLLVIRKPGDPKNRPTVSQQMPTKVAEWIESLADLETRFHQHLQKFL